MVQVFYNIFNDVNSAGVSHTCKLKSCHLNWPQGNLNKPKHLNCEPVNCGSNVSRCVLRHREKLSGIHVDNTAFHSKHLLKKGSYAIFVEVHFSLEISIYLAFIFCLQV